MTKARWYNLIAGLGWFVSPFTLNYTFGPFNPLFMLAFVILTIFVIDMCIRDFIDNKI